jgi:hypothetical protein
MCIKFKSLLFQQQWVMQSNSGRNEDNDSLVGQKLYTTLSYLVDVKPKLWLPVQLVEGRLCKEIKMNLVCIREEAQRAAHNTLHVQ